MIAYIQQYTDEYLNKTNNPPIIVGKKGKIWPNIYQILQFITIYLIVYALILLVLPSYIHKQIYHTIYFVYIHVWHVMCFDVILYCLGTPKQKASFS
jgi:hypothetical protein